MRTHFFFFTFTPVIYFSASNLVTSVPMCGRISTANSSPSLRNSLGVYPKPTPAGVPVKIIVPGGSVVPCDKKETIFGTEKTRSLNKSQQGFQFQKEERLTLLHNPATLFHS